jgi:hypothetical protein
MRGGEGIRWVGVASGDAARMGGGAGAGVGRNGTGNRGDGRARSALRLLGNDRKLMSCVCFPVRALDFLPVN